ncbi:type II toxin-antitoxin system VapC family toxin [Rhizobium sp. G21]|nr:type II toxin-antitoxin system VapC family toxin [Rhizobium sp. G21]
MTDFRFMLDTNIVSDMLRNPQGHAVQRGEAEGKSALCLSVITACELKYGIYKRASQALRSRISVFLEDISILALEPEVDETYALLRLDLERRGKPIGPNDLLIAAHARSLDLTLVTDNIREFSRLDGLKLENWIERPAA